MWCRHERSFNTPASSEEQLASYGAVCILSPAHYAIGRTGRRCRDLASLVTRFDPVISLQTG